MNVAEWSCGYLRWSSAEWIRVIWHPASGVKKNTNRVRNRFPLTSEWYGVKNIHFRMPPPERSIFGSARAA